MIWAIIFELVISAIILFFAIYIHELGHKIQIKKYGHNKKVYYDKEKKSFNIDIPSNLTKKQKLNILEAGILSGFIVIVFSIFFIKIFFIPLVILYIIGSKHDIKEMVRLNKIKD